MEFCSDELMSRYDINPGMEAVIWRVIESYLERFKENKLGNESDHLS